MADKEMKLLTRVFFACISLLPLTAISKTYDTQLKNDMLPSDFDQIDDLTTDIEISEQTDDSSFASLIDYLDIMSVKFQIFRTQDGGVVVRIPKKDELILAAQIWEASSPK